MLAIVELDDRVAHRERRQIGVAQTLVRIGPPDGRGVNGHVDGIRNHLFDGLGDHAMLGASPLGGVDDLLRDGDVQRLGTASALQRRIVPLGNHAAFASMLTNSSRLAAANAVSRMKVDSGRSALFAAFRSSRRSATVVRTRMLTGRFR